MSEPISKPTAEEIRVDMRRRFDAANADAKARREIRYAADAAKQLKEKDSRLTAIEPIPEIGENDSSGG